METKRLKGEVSSYLDKVARLINLKKPHLELIKHTQKLRALADEYNGHPDILLTLAQLHLAQADTKAAHELLSQLAVDHPHHLPSLLYYGTFQLEKGDHQNALNQFTRLLQLDPRHAEGHYQLGRVYQESGYFEQAVQHFEKAHELAPKNLEFGKALSTILQRFVPPWHIEMLADHERNNAFYEAIAGAVDENSVVLDIGTGSGLLSMMAAKAGAKQVITCEQSPFLAKTAEKIIARNGLQDRIKVHQAKSTDLQPHHFSQAPNLIIGEIFDAGLIGEWAIPSFRHALTTLCDVNCQIIPQKAKIVGRLVELPDYAPIHPITKIEGFDLSDFNIYQTDGAYLPKHLNQVRHKFLSPPFEMMSYDFQELPEPISPQEPQKKAIDIVCDKSGSATAVAFWFQLWLSESITLTSDPTRENNHWAQAIFFLPNRRHVVPGETMELLMYYHDHDIWFE